MSFLGVFPMEIYLEIFKWLPSVYYSPLRFVHSYWFSFFSSFKKTSLLYVLSSKNSLLWCLENGLPLDETLFERAVAFGTNDLLELLLELSCPMGEKLTFWAARAGNLASLNWLKEHSFSPDEKTFKGAARGGQLLLLKHLFQTIPDPPKTPSLFYAALRGASPEVLQFLREQQVEGGKPLELLRKAVQGGSLELVKEFATSRARSQISRSTKKPLPGIAARKGYLELLYYLLEELELDPGEKRIAKPRKAYYPCVCVEALQAQRLEVYSCFRALKIPHSCTLISQGLEISLSKPGNEELLTLLWGQLPPGRICLLSEVKEFSPQELLRMEELLTLGLPVKPVLKTQAQAPLPWLLELAKLEVKPTEELHRLAILTGSLQLLETLHCKGWRVNVKLLRFCFEHWGKGSEPWKLLLSSWREHPTGEARGWKLLFQTEELELLPLLQERAPWRDHYGELVPKNTTLESLLQALGFLLPRG